MKRQISILVPFVVVLITASPAKASGFVDSDFSVQDFLEENIQSARDFFGDLAGDAQDALSSLYGTVANVLPPDVIGALGLPDPQEMTRIAREESSDGALFTDATALSEGRTSATKAAAGMVLSTESQQNATVAAEDAANRVNAAIACDEVAQGSVVTQDVMKQVSCQMTQNAELMRKAHEAAQTANITGAHTAEQLADLNAREEAKRTADAEGQVADSARSIWLSGQTGLF
ncbi:hypothetical protein IQ268_16765 [Oculatella sp. LEGE 06141]|uniref:hypothetical protein n=1 Tax=Oculatella sp. LEGE 06141 TaxID=1828648 RepID=UPI0018815153|nr:hypothetical protein [Oculatella sp. LEGE 06141]MBE9180217.1 hypothetical protein [Oculatella sp. LEGE 06141]